MCMSTSGRARYNIGTSVLSPSFSQTFTFVSSSSLSLSPMLAFARSCAASIAQLPHAVRVQVRLQHPLQQLALGPHVARQAPRNGIRRPPVGQAVQDAPPVPAEDVRQRPAQPHSVVVQRLVDRLRAQLRSRTSLRR